MKKVGVRIMQRRRELGIRQNDFADMVGLSKNQVSNIENGNSYPSIKSFVNICNASGVTPDYFLLGAVKSEPNEDIVDALRLCSKEEQETIARLIEAYLLSKGRMSNSGRK